MRYRPLLVLLSETVTAAATDNDDADVFSIVVIVAVIVIVLCVCLFLCGLCLFSFCPERRYGFKEESHFYSE